MKDTEKSMPVFGVGPIFVITTVLVTVISVVLNRRGTLVNGKNTGETWIFTALEIIFIALGAYLWLASVIGSKINKNAKEGKLITTGVYGIVRNPVYSAFLAISTGVIIGEKNAALFVVPLVLWIFLTILMKNTEEKWLYQNFGEEYLAYKRSVNRVIPWFRKK